MINDIINVIGGQKKSMNIIGEAKKRISSLPTGTQFSLNDLFTGIEWNNFEKKDRLLAGRNFFSLVEDKKISNVESNGKTNGNKQTHIKNERRMITMNRKERP